MAKRKRLDPANTAFSQELSIRPEAQRAAPIADVASDAATRAAFEEVAGALSSARAEGRLIQSLPLQDIQTDHLVRDRMALDAAEMEALQTSLAARGQQTPIEVVALSEGRYGLISGWRRVEALKSLGEANVLALVRAPRTADAAYVAMVEENEIRAGLSYYERARLAAEAVRIGIYPDVRAAVQSLFANAGASKRSKILNFVSLHAELDSVLSYPTAIPERLGLALASALDKHDWFARRLKDAHRKTPPQDAAAERALLERALKKTTTSGTRPPASKPVRETVGPGLVLELGKGRLALSGKGLDADFVDDLRNWLASRS